LDLWTVIDWSVVWGKIGQFQERGRRRCLPPWRFRDAEMTDFGHTPAGRGGFRPWVRYTALVVIDTMSVGLPAQGW